MMKYPTFFGAILALILGAYAFHANAQPPPHAGPESVGSYFFSLIVTGAPAEVQDNQTVLDQILITGVDINTNQVSNQRCSWLITRDTPDIGTVGGITNSTTLFFHVAYETGSVHHEFKEPALVSAGQAFHIFLQANSGTCSGVGILRFTVD